MIHETVRVTTEEGYKKEIICLWIWKKTKYGKSYEPTTNAKNILNLYPQWERITDNYLKKPR